MFITWYFAVPVLPVPARKEPYLPLLLTWYSSAGLCRTSSLCTSQEGTRRIPAPHLVLLSRSMSYQFSLYQPGRNQTYPCSWVIPSLYACRKKNTCYIVQCLCVHCTVQCTGSRGRSYSVQCTDENKNRHVEFMKCSP